jgi:DNA-nicking Smr family endonuclease
MKGKRWRQVRNLKSISRQGTSMAKLKLDLHDIYNRGDQIDAELNRIVQEAIERKIELVEIVPGKGSGQLKKKVLRFLNQGHIRRLYHRLEKDDKNFGRIFIHFKF